MKLYEISHRKFAKYLHVKILRNIIRNFTKYHMKLYEIPYETLRNITYRNLYVKILRNVTNVILKICEMLRLEALRNITSKILRSITCQILRKYTNYHEILCIRNIAMASETYEIFSRENFTQIFARKNFLMYTQGV